MKASNLNGNEPLMCIYVLYTAYLEMCGKYSFKYGRKLLLRHWRICMVKFTWEGRSYNVLHSGSKSTAGPAIFTWEEKLKGNRLEQKIFVPEAPSPLQIQILNPWVQKERCCKGHTPHLLQMNILRFVCVPQDCGFAGGSQSGWCWLQTQT